MLEVIDSLYMTRNFCKENADLFDNRFEFHENCFHMMANAATLAIELLSFYKEVWMKPITGASEEQAEKIQKQNWDKTNEITRWAFIAAVSGVEFSLKTIIRKIDRGPLKALIRKKRLNLSIIIEKCNKHRLIDQASYDEWTPLRMIRNNMVHNNAIADYDAEYNVSGVRVSFVENQMIQGNLLFFSHMISCLARHTQHLIQSIFERHQLM